MNTNLLQTSLKGTLGDLEEIGRRDDFEKNVELVLVLVDLFFSVKQHASGMRWKMEGNEEC